MRLLAPIFLHLAFLAAVITGVWVSLPAQPQMVLAVRSSWVIEPASKNFFPWGSRPPQANNLSGIVWLGGDRYALVSDKGSHLLWGEIAVDPASGAVVSARILPEVATVAGGRDLEDCAVVADGRSLVVCDENDTSLVRVPLAWGQGGEVSPAEKVHWLFNDCRLNLSLESLAAAADGRGFWTMNEDARICDGVRAHIATGPQDPEAGAWLRILKVDAHLRPVRQWAYRSDPVPGNLVIPLMISGVSALAALPDGQLLVLERGLGSEGFRLRFYLVDPLDSQPDAAAAAALPGEPAIQPLTKRLLFEWRGRANLEGLVLGPELADGSRSLLLVSDDGDPFSKSGLLALKLRRVGGVTGR